MDLTDQKKLHDDERYLFLAALISLVAITGTDTSLEFFVELHIY